MLLTSLLLLTSLKAQEKQQEDKAQEKVEAATKVLTDFKNMEENIPEQLLKVTEGVIVIPKLINAGFVLAGKRGKVSQLLKKRMAHGAIRFL